MTNVVPQKSSPITTISTPESSIQSKRYQ